MQIQSGPFLLRLSHLGRLSVRLEVEHARAEATRECLF